MKKIFTTFIAMLTIAPYIMAQCNTVIFNDETEHSFSVVWVNSYDDVPGITDEGTGMLNQSGISSREFVEVNINKPASELSFEAYSTGASIGKIINVGVSSDGGKSYSKIYQSESLGSNYTLQSGIQLPEKVTNLVFYTLKSQSATLSKYVKNIQITQKSFLRAISAAPQLGEINYGEEAGFDIEFEYSNLPEAISVTSTSSLLKPEEESVETGCGDYQPTYVIHVNVAGSASGVYNEKIVLTSGSYTLEIPVSFKVKAPYTVSVPPTPSPIEVGQTLSESTFEGGYADTPGHFEWENPDIAPAVGDGQIFNIIFYPDNTEYPTTIISVMIDVKLKSQEIEWQQSDIENLTVGAVVELTATATSGLPVEYSVNNPEIASIEGNTLTAHAAGEVEIYVSQAGNDTYAPAATVTAYITISEQPQEKQEQTITWEQDLTSLTVGDVVELTATASSGLQVEYRVDNESLASIEGNKLTALAAGTVTVYASQKGDDTYKEAPEAILFAVINAPLNERIAQAIVWDQDFDVLHVGDVVELTATATSGLEVTYYVNDENLASIEGNVLTVLAAGQLEIYAQQNGNEQYQPAMEEVRYATIDVADALQAITPDVSVTIYNGTINVNATNLNRVEIFNTNGQLVADTQAEGQATINLNGHKGMFVMVCHINSERMAHKFVIR